MGDLGRGQHAKKRVGEARDQWPRLRRVGDHRVAPMRRVMPLAGDQHASVADEKKGVRRVQQGCGRVEDLLVVSACKSLLGGHEDDRVALARLHMRPRARGRGQEDQRLGDGVSDGLGIGADRGDVLRGVLHPRTGDAAHRADDRAELADRADPPFDFGEPAGHCTSPARAMSLTSAATAATSAALGAASNRPEARTDDTSSPAVPSSQPGRRRRSSGIRAGETPSSTPPASAARIATCPTIDSPEKRGWVSSARMRLPRSIRPCTRALGTPPKRVNISSS